MTERREQEIREYAARADASRVGIGREALMIKELLHEVDVMRALVMRCACG